MPVEVRAHRRAAVALVTALALLAPACGSSDDADGAGSDDADRSSQSADQPDGLGEGDGTAGSEGADDRAWPIPDWETAEAAEVGMDQALLDEMAAEAEAAGSMCLVVTRDGMLVDEYYWQGADETTEQEVFSASKSVSSTLVGIAADRGLLDLDEPASNYIEEWKGTPSESVTIRNLVSNDSGRYQDVVSDYVTMAAEAPDKTQYAIDLDQQHEPGSQWVYNNAAIQTLDRVLEEATGMPTAEFARTALFEPLGMESQVATDEAGNALMFMGTQASCRDMARFGLLFLRDGRWGDEQVVSSEWVDEATRPSQPLNASYGFLWWLNGAGEIANPDGQGVRTSLASEAPNDLFAALGLGNQVVAVIPSTGVVAVRIGPVNQPPDTPSFTVEELGNGVSRAIVDPDGG